MLRADEIDVRVGTVKEGNGVSYLLYKDARCDMSILDETFGAMNWKREHTRDNANCIVSVWDDEKKCWVSKEDTGTESNTEKEKGLASDSFKRACVNWGIGRELYTAPFIWLSGDTNKLKYEKLAVKTITYDDQRNIKTLVLVDSRDNEVYWFGVRRTAGSTTMPAPTPTDTPIQPTADTTATLTPQAKAKKFLIENPRAFEYYQKQYSQFATLDEFDNITLTKIFQHLKSNNKL